MNDNRQHKNRIDELLRQLNDESTDTETKEQIRAWLWSDASSDLKEQSLIESIGRLQPNLNPDAYEHNKYREQAVRLGFAVAPAPANKRRLSLTKRWLIGAASTAAVVAVALLLFNKPELPTTPEYAQIEIAALLETERVVSLPDSSTITLEQGGRIHYAENFEQERVIYLEGEAFFSVAHLDGKPFKVISNSITVTVYGTEFQVKAYSDASTAEVKLASGSVAVTAEGIEETMLVPGQHFIYEKEHQTITLDEIGEGELLRLLRHNLTLEGQSLDEAFHMMSQYFGVQFHIAADLDLSERGAISFEDNVTLDEALALIRMIAVTPFDYTIQDSTVTITKRKQ